MADGAPDAKSIDARLEAIVNRMFQRCLDDGQYRQAMGLALETRRMDIFEASIRQADDMITMLTYAFQVIIKKYFQYPVHNWGRCETSKSFYPSNTQKSTETIMD